MDPTRDESLIFELLDYKHEVGDEGSAIWFLQDLATEQEAEGGMVFSLFVFFFTKSFNHSTSLPVKNRLFIDRYLVT